MLLLPSGFLDLWTRNDFGLAGKHTGSWHLIFDPFFGLICFCVYRTGFNQEEDDFNCVRILEEIVWPEI